MKYLLFLHKPLPLKHHQNGPNKPNGLNGSKYTEGDRMDWSGPK